MFASQVLAISSRLLPQASCEIHIFSFLLHVTEVRLSISELKNNNNSNISVPFPKVVGADHTSASMDLCLILQPNNVLDFGEVWTRDHVHQTLWENLINVHVLN